MLLDNRATDIEYPGGFPHGGRMKQIILALALLLIALPAHAACFADYKAKRDNPLRLHYGVVEISGPCTAANARAQITGRIAADGWQLLNVVSVFGEDGLAERKESAGTFYLRY